ncbi:hypothetical protein [Natranaerovirga hydrolytica]|uniref:hypothetical protein n=1 Tax=Natranaerovirga hydrolytica TaxID=680378 RepID=UPI0010457AD7|nr:hypothetical protein [Natranaerovirga hydrolytica]
MKWETFRKLIFIITIVSIIVFIKQTEEPVHEFEIAAHYLEESYTETGAINAATAIYLDYRVYDSLFESLLLLVSAVGIYHFNKEENHGRN